MGSIHIDMSAVSQSASLNVHALTGCFSVDEFRENLVALETELAPEEIEWLDLRRDER